MSVCVCRCGLMVCVGIVSVYMYVCEGGWEVHVYTYIYKCVYMYICVNVCKCLYKCVMCKCVLYA